MNNVTSTLEQISKEWIMIAQLLDLSSNVINIIHVSHLEDDRMKLRRVIEWWFKSTPNPEWNKIDEVLEKGILIICMHHCLYSYLFYYSYCHC